jgi:hypothetical protein
MGAGALAVFAAASALVAVVWVGASGAGQKPNATTAFSIFSTSPTTQAPTELSSKERISENSDLGQVHEIAADLGSYRTKLLIWPAQNGTSVCYALVHVYAYCYPLSDPIQSAGGEHFNVSRLQSRISGHVGTAVFGVAFDDVVRLRIQVNGAWRPVRLYKNGFYIELPNTFFEDCTFTPLYKEDGVTTGNFDCRPSDRLVLEATLAEGTRQVHDIRTNQAIL